MYATLDKRTVKALNRLDKRRRMKYDGKHREGYRAEELRAEREEVGEAEVRYARELSRPAHRYATSNR
jgi:hypothetical protein